MTTATPDIKTILEPVEPRSPGKCHTIDHRGYAICGGFRSRLDENGNPTGLHSRRECRAKRHRHCVACDEIDRQMGDDGMMSA